MINARDLWLQTNRNFGLPPHMSLSQENEKTQYPVPIMAITQPLSVTTRKKLEDAGDWLTIGVAVSLPWSTSATGVFIALWIVTQLCTLDVTARWRELIRPAACLPVILWVMAAVGMLWADVPWQERFAV
jgi:hypothetical protein